MNLQLWKRLSITVRFGVSMSLLLLIMVGVMLAGYASQDTTAEAVESMVSLAEIQRGVLDIDRALNNARLLRRSFLTEYPRIGANEAQQRYALPAFEFIAAAVQSANNLHTLIQSQGNTALYESYHEDAESYIVLAGHYEDTFAASVDGVLALETPDVGLIAQMEQRFGELAGVVQAANNPGLRDLYDQMQHQQIAYLAAQSPTALQALYVTEAQMRDHLQTAPNHAIDLAGRVEILTVLESYHGIVKEVVSAYDALNDVIAEFQNHTGQAVALLARLDSKIDSQVRDTHSQMLHSRQRAKTLLAGITLGGVLVAAGVIVLLNRNVTTGILRLTETARRFQAGDLNAQAQVDGDDELGELARTFNSMTNRIHRTVVELGRNEARFRSIIDSSPIGMHLYRLDSAGKLIFEESNPAARRLMGLETLLVGSSLETAFPALAETDIPAQFHRVATEGRLWRGEFAGYGGPDDPHVYDIQAFQIAPGVMIATFLDITGRKQAEREHARLNYIMDHSRNEIFLFDPDTLRFIYANRGAQENLGYSLEILRDLTPIDLKPEFDRERFEALIRPLRTGERDEIRLTTLHRRHNSSTYPVEVSLQLMTFESESVFVAVVLDITSRRRIEAYLQRELAITATLSALYRPVVSTSVSLREIAGEVLEHAKILTGSKHGYISEIDPETQDNVCHTFTAMIPDQDARLEKPQKIVFSPDEDGTYPGLQGYSLNTREPFFTNAPASHSASTGVPEGHIPLQRFLSVPVLLGDNDLVGQIALANANRDYEDSDIGIIQRLAEYYGLAVQRNRMEEALRESETRFRLIINSIDDVIFTLDTQQRHTGVFGRWLERAAVDKSFFLGRSSRDLFGEGLAVRHEAANTRALQGETVVYEWENNNTPDGEMQSYQTSVSPIYNDDGEITGVVGVGRNITQIRQAEAALRESERQYQLLFDSMLDGYAIHEAICDDTGEMVDYVYLDINPAFERFTGIDRENVIGRRVLEVFPGLEQPWIDVYGDVALHGKTARFEDYAQPLGKWFEVSAFSPARKQFVTVFRDITERKQVAHALEQYAAELARSNAELEQFAYVASHDLQEPLRMVASYTKLLANRYAGQLDSDADEFIAYAVDGATRMQRLIEDLLRYSRVGTRGKELVPIDSDQVLALALNNLEAAVEETGAQISCESLPVVMGDETQLIQLFQNLLANAIKFHSDAQPVVHISAVQEGEFWQFAIRDNGIGIEPQYFERIFTIFQRLHTRADYPGTGIGLALCKRIVERHGGRIWVESQVGQGTTFFFTLRPTKESSTIT